MSDHHPSSGNGNGNGHGAFKRKQPKGQEVFQGIGGPKAGGGTQPERMPKDIGLMITLMGVGLISLSVVCLYIAAARTVCICLLLLTLGSMLAKNEKGEEARYEKLVVGLIMVPFVILAFFFQPVAQAVFIYSLQFGAALVAYGIWGERVARFKKIVPYVVAAVTLIVVLLLNSKQLLDLVSRVMVR